MQVKQSFDKITPDNLESNDGLEKFKIIPKSSTPYFQRYTVRLKNEDGEYEHQLYQKSLCKIHYHKYGKQFFIKRVDFSTGSEKNHLDTHEDDIEDEKDKQNVIERKSNKNVKRKKETQQKQNSKKQLTIQQSFQKAQEIVDNNNLIKFFYEQLNEDQQYYIYMKSIYTLCMIVIKDMQPLHTFERETFKKYYELAYPNFVIPSRKKINVLINKLYQIGLQQLKIFLKQQKVQQRSYGFTQDGSTVGRKHLIVTNIGFCRLDWDQYQNVFLSIQEVQKQDGISIAKHISSVLKNFDLVSQLQDLEVQNQTGPQMQQEQEELNESSSSGEEYQIEDYDKGQNDSNYGEDEQEEIFNISISQEEKDSSQSYGQSIEESVESDSSDDQQQNEQEIEMTTYQIDQIAADYDENGTLNEQFSFEISLPAFNYEEQLENLQQNSILDNPTELKIHASDAHSANIKAQQYIKNFSQSLIIDNLHMNHNAILDAVKKCPKVVEVFQKADKIVAHLRNSPKSRSALLKVFKQQNKLILEQFKPKWRELRSTVQTRWEGRVNQLEDIVHMHSFIKKLYNSKFPKLKKHKLKQEDIQLITEIIPILQNMKKFTKYFQSQSSKLSNLIPSYYTILNKIKQQNSDSENIKLFKKKLQFEIQRRYHNFIFSNSSTLEIALKSTFLNPQLARSSLLKENKDLYQRTKQQIKLEAVIYEIYFRQNNEENQLQQSQQENISQNNNNQNQNDKADQQSQQSDDSQQNSSYSNFFASKKVKTGEQNDNNQEEEDQDEEIEMQQSNFKSKKQIIVNQIDQELLNYENLCKELDVRIKKKESPFINFQKKKDVLGQYDIVEIWQKIIKEGEYIFLSPIANSYLSLLGSSVVNEQDFSKVTYTLNKYRLKTLPENLNKMIFLKNNIKYGCIKNEELFDEFIKITKLKQWSK